MQEYARQAKDGQLIAHATDIRMRAEIRAGELLTEMAERGERAVRGQAQKSHGETFQPAQLSDLGVTKTQSSRWQKMAALPPEKQEERIEAAKAKAVAAVEGTAPNRTSFTGENEWFTPVEWLDRARDVLEEIDLDPESHPIAQERVKAAQFF